MRAARDSLLFLGAALALIGCSFDNGGVGDDVAPDASGEVDTDDDGVADADDNCPEVANPNQRDEDADGVGNACDNCPGLANADQANTGETDAGAEADGAGDACDPEPAAAGNDILVFEPFDDPSAFDAWRAVGGGNWSIANGALRQTSTAASYQLYLVARNFGSLALDARIVLDDVPGSSGPSDTNRSFGAFLAFEPTSGNGNGYLCLLYTNPQNPTAGSLHLSRMQASSPAEALASGSLGAGIQEGATYRVTETLAASTGDLACGAASDALPAPVSLTAQDPSYDNGFIGFRANKVGLHVEHLVVYSIAD